MEIHGILNFRWWLGDAQPPCSAGAAAGDAGGTCHHPSPTPSSGLCLCELPTPLWVVAQTCMKSCPRGGKPHSCPRAGEPRCEPPCPPHASHLGSIAGPVQRILASGRLSHEEMAFPCWDTLRKAPFSLWLLWLWWFSILPLHPAKSSSVILLLIMDSMPMVLSVNQLK